MKAKSEEQCALTYVFALPYFFFFLEKKSQIQFLCGFFEGSGTLFASE